MLTRDIIRVMSKPLKMSFSADKVKITRAGLSTNPLERFSYAGGGSIFRNDELVTTKGVITEVSQSKTYDFANKVANSTVNCPMRIGWSRSATLTSPSFTGDQDLSYWEDNIQSDYDRMKTQDGNPTTWTTNINGGIAKFLVELDLTDLVNQQGGLTRFKDLLTGFTVDAWAKGSGVNGGVATNGVTMKVASYAGNWDYFGAGGAQNSSGSITKMSTSQTTLAKDAIWASNKMYILIHASNASNGPTPSSVSLDYISIKIDYKQRSVTSDGLFFVGGDTATYEYDMSLKIAGSVAECPMKIYRQGAVTTLLDPTNAAWAEWNTQANIDLLKTQDGTSLSYSGATSSGQISQYLIELDLTPLCNSMFGGSNAALKAALKAITADVWAMGSGSNGGVSANGVNVKPYNANGSTWATGINSNNSGISKVTLNNTNMNASDWGSYIVSSNKLYILIASQYASDGTIASSVSLDYFNIKIDLARTADTVQPISISLPKYWAMVLNGFSPSWDSTNPKGGRILQLRKDSNNYFELVQGSGSWWVTKYINGTKYEVSALIGTISKFQNINFILYQTASKWGVKLLKNNNVVEKIETPDSNTMTGLFSLYELQDYSAISAQTVSAFAESFNPLDLQRLGKVRFGPELVSNGDFSNGQTGWSIEDGSWTFNSGVSTLTVSDGSNYRNIFQKITVLPNTTYVLQRTTNGRVYGDLMNGTTFISNTPISNGSGEIAFTTPSNCNSVTLNCDNSTLGNGSYTFDNISLKQVLQDGLLDSEAEILLRGVPVPDPNKELVQNGGFDTQYGNELVLNGDFSLGVTGWTIYSPAIWNLSTGRAIQTPTAGYQEASQIVGLSANTQYLLSADVTTDSLTPSSIAVILEYRDSANSILGYSSTAYSARKSAVITTPANCTNARVIITNNTSIGGTNTFDNISLKQVLPASTGWTGTQGTWDFSSGKASTSNATTYTSVTSQKISVIPNQSYLITADTVNGAMITVDALQESTKISTIKGGNVPMPYTFTTPNNCNYVLVNLTNGGTINSTVTLDNISLKYVKPAGAIAIENPELFDINKVSLHANAQRMGNVIVLNPTAGYQNSIINIPVLPNNRYTLTFARSSATYVHVYELHNTILVKQSTYISSGFTFVTQPQTNVVSITFGNNPSSGTCIFSNISLRRND